MEKNREEALLPGLPDDLATLCLLRLSPLHHHRLRSVCRRWRQLVSSQTFFQLRQKHNLSQEWLCAMVRNNRGEYQWIMFVEESGTWARLPPQPRQVIGAACVVNSGKIYMIGGSKGEISSRSMWRFDPRLNRWEMAAPMKVAREFAAAGSIGDRIYVLGGCLPGKSMYGATSWAEVYDPVTDSWNSIPSPDECRFKWMHGSAVLRNKLLVVSDMGGLVFDPLTLSWDCITPRLDQGWRNRAAVVDGVLFCCNNISKILGYVIEDDIWLEVQGYEKDIPEMKSCVMLANVAGKLYVLWEVSKNRVGTNLALASLDISREHNVFKAAVLWYRIVPCNIVIEAIIHSVSLAL